MGVMGEHAVVIGASMAGLVAAKALAPRFRQVTVFERDTLPDQAENRRAGPHGGHAPALLISGRPALEKLFPGLTDELVEGGAVLFDRGHDLLCHQMGAPRVRFAGGGLGVRLSRAHLEHAVRGRVAALEYAGIRDRTPVHELVLDRGRVTGVELGEGERIPDDLVVDATGRGGGGPAPTLQRHGFPEPEVDTVKIDVGYTTRLLHRSPGDLHDGALLYLTSAVPCGPPGRPGASRTPAGRPSPGHAALLAARRSPARRSASGPADRPVAARGARSGPVPHTVPR
ncbi:NAD(P)/FAD-dependent oxidoreductase [Streptomyces sp. NPDC001848]|uniref:NAD(P)/FAD-dependent oxidoreductase n=1 Tax=Streptomyces sp. NPDC001848 TaxID=3364618 RepID=UPI00368CFAE9